MKKSIDNVTPKNLSVGLRFIGIDMPLEVLDKIIDIVELMEEKGGGTTIDDLWDLQAEWQKTNAVIVDDMKGAEQPRTSEKSLPYVATAPFFIKLLLLFCKKRYRIQHDLYDTKVEYKMLFGEIYVLAKWDMPPTHPGCKCVITETGSRPTEWTEAPE